MGTIDDHGYRQFVRYHVHGDALADLEHLAVRRARRRMASDAPPVRDAHRHDYPQVQ